MAPKIEIGAFVTHKGAVMGKKTTKNCSCIIEKVASINIRIYRIS